MLRQNTYETSSFLHRVFGWMFVGLIVSGVAAYGVAFSPALMQAVYGNPIIFYAILLGEVLLVFGITGMINKISASAAIVLFLLYCLMSGLTLSVIFLLYTTSSIESVFFISAAMFGAMALYGSTTKRDLSGMGQILIMALFGIIIAMVVNFFLNSGPLDYALSCLGVVVFAGLTAYDIQKLMRLGSAGYGGTQMAIFGALTLYLDLVNLFLDLLRIFGKRK